MSVKYVPGAFISTLQGPLWFITQYEGIETPYWRPSQFKRLGLEYQIRERNAYPLTPSDAEFWLAEHRPLLLVRKGKEAPDEE